MMNRWQTLDRKGFVTTLGAAGLGLGLIVAAAGGAPGALAQEVSTPALAQDEAGTAESDVRVRLRSGELREELYGEFTAALADELGAGNADEIDAAIRVAMMTVVDARVDDGLLTVGQAEALKTLIATSDVPLGPGPMFGPPPGAFMRGGHGFGDEGRHVQIRDGDREWIIQTDDGSPADDGDDQNAASDQEANDDAGSNADEADDESP
jgi:hypothetical protein